MKAPRRTSNMWSKTAAAFLWGLVLSASLMINLYFLLPFSVGGTLLFSVIFGFIFWGLVMCFCYSIDRVWQASRYCLWVFAVSAIGNTFFLVIH